MNKRILKVFITIIIILATAALVLAITGGFRGSEADIYRNTPAGESSAESPPVSLTGDTSVPDQQAIANFSDISPVPSPEPIQDNNDMKSPGPGDSQTSEAAQTEGANIIDDLPPAGSDWLEVKIQQHIDDIDPKDLEDFRAIISKLDQAYIRNLAIDGFTSEEQELLKEHLHSRLSSAEYERAKQLFYNYDFLLDEV